MTYTRSVLLASLLSLTTPLLTACGGSPSISKRTYTVRGHRGSRATQRPVNSRLLIELQDSPEARIIAAIESNQWRSPSSVHDTTLRNLGSARSEFQGLHSTANPATVNNHGQLKGGIRDSCGDLYIGLLMAPATRGLAVATPEGTAPIEFQLAPVKPNTKSYRATAEILRAGIGIPVAPRIEAAYEVDLNGDGLLETIIQATHADLTQEKPRTKPEHYSIIVVVPGDANALGENATYVGYIEARRERVETPVLQLETVADLDGDGQQEILVRSFDREGQYIEVYRYDGELHQVFETDISRRYCTGQTTVP